MYVPTGLGAADTQWQQNSATNQGQLNYGGGFASQVDPNIASAYQQLGNINYTPYLQQQQALGQTYGQVGQQSLQAGQQIYQSAFDPQQALYSRTQQQITDQSAAANSMYGLGSSAQGAALQNQANENFNIDWQNQQLARQTQGAEAMSGLNQIGLGDIGQGNQLPITSQQQVAQQGFTNAQNYSTALGAAMAPYNQQENQNIPYMNYGSGAGANAYQNTLAGQAQQNNMLQQAGNALGNVNWSQLSNLFGGGSGLNSGNSYYSSSGTQYANNDLSGTNLGSGD